MSDYIKLFLALASVVATYFANKYSKKLKQIFDLVDEVEKALEDGKLTEDELKEIINKIKAIGDRR